MKNTVLDSQSRKFLRRENIIIQEIPGRKVKNIFNKHKSTSKNKLQESGIYEIKCEDCEQKYIGQSSRSVGIRIQEHLDSVLMGGKKYRRTWNDVKEKATVDPTGIVKHMVETGHKTDKEQVSLIQKCNRGNLDLMESYHIWKEKDKLMNIKPGPLEGTKTFNFYCKLMNP